MKRKWNLNVCDMCVHVARTGEWARKNDMDLFGKITPYNANKDKNGHEVGCSPLCPYLEISIRTLG